MESVNNNLAVSSSSGWWQCWSLMETHCSVWLSAGWNCKCTRSALMTPALLHKPFTSTSDDPAGTHCNITPKTHMNTHTNPSITSSRSLNAVSQLSHIASCSSTDSAENNGGSPWQHEMLLLLLSLILNQHSVDNERVLACVHEKLPAVVVLCLYLCGGWRIALCGGGTAPCARHHPPERPPSPSICGHCCTGTDTELLVSVNGSAEAESCSSRDARGSSSGRARARLTYGSRHRVLF